MKALTMKALLSASSSLSRCLLSSQSVAGRKYVATAAAAHCASVARQTMQLCTVYEHTSHKFNFLDVSSKTMTMTHPSRRLMGTSAQKGGDDDIDVAVQAANERCSGQLQIKRVNPNQWGVFAHRPYKKGSIVISSNLANNQPNPKTTSCSHSIQTNFNQHILMDLPAQFLNHSCDPNIGVAINLNEGQSYDFIALRDIPEDEEIRFDYETTEYEVGAFEDCMCGVESCRGTIKGFKYSKDVILEKYGGKNIAPYLME